MTRECDVHIMRHLRCKLVVYEGRDEADHGSRDAETNVYPIGVGQSWCLCQTVHAPPDRNEFSRIFAGRTASAGGLQVEWRRWFEASQHVAGRVFGLRLGSLL